MERHGKLFYIISKYRGRLHSALGDLSPLTIKPNVSNYEHKHFAPRLFAPRLRKNGAGSAWGCPELTEAEDEVECLARRSSVKRYDHKQQGP